MNGELKVNGELSGELKVNGELSGELNVMIKGEW